MPIYEYQCNACGHAFESLQKISEDPLKDCPQCSEAELKKLVSAAGFRLKGSGWYETDFKGKKKSEEKSGDSGDSKPKDKSSDKKSTKKADSKSTAA